MSSTAGPESMPGGDNTAMGCPRVVSGLRSTPFTYSVSQTHAWVRRNWSARTSPRRWHSGLRSLTERPKKPAPSSRSSAEHRGNQVALIAAM